MIPDDDSTYDEEAILAILNEEMDVGLLDTLLTLFEDNITTHKDFTISDEGRYVIPHRAVGNKLRDLSFVDGMKEYELSRIDIGELSDYGYDVGYDDTTTDVFYIEGDEIVLINPRFRSSTANLRMYFHIRPNYIVEEDECAQISSIDRNTGLITFDSIPAEFASLTTLDFVQDKTPNKILAVDIPVSSVSTSTRSITVNPANIPRRLSVGDWVCFPEESPYPNIPTELHPVLAQRAAVHILEALGDNENLGSAKQKLAQMEKSVQKIIDQRVDTAPRKIKSRFGTLNASNTAYRSRRGRF